MQSHAGVIHSSGMPTRLPSACTSAQAGHRVTSSWEDASELPGKPRLLSGPGEVAACRAERVYNNSNTLKAKLRFCNGFHHASGPGPVVVWLSMNAGAAGQDDTLMWLGKMWT